MNLDGKRAERLAHEGQPRRAIVQPRVVERRDAVANPPHVEPTVAAAHHAVERPVLLLKGPMAAFDERCPYALDRLRRGRPAQLKQRRGHRSLEDGHAHVHVQNLRGVEVFLCAHRRSIGWNGEIALVVKDGRRRQRPTGQPRLRMLHKLGAHQAEEEDERARRRVLCSSSVGSRHDCTIFRWCVGHVLDLWHFCCAAERRRRRWRRRALSTINRPTWKHERTFMFGLPRAQLEAFDATASNTCLCHPVVSD